ncbi:hypothetical protein RHSIM_Rhsim12G0192500 [Rhododendron simsii]|uniref:DUF761 domain-containing protein n=1 Tax=Rhododendron simsii TaxID=118357 RepID=A0A834G271_RHOSS|nr:hypothetical protein RHSIM_Rhsim12G0192500 [Rhododendron simsii]
MQQKNLQKGSKKSQGLKRTRLRRYLKPHGLALLLKVISQGLPSALRAIRYQCSPAECTTLESALLGRLGSFSIPSSSKALTKYEENQSGSSERSDPTAKGLREPKKLGVLRREPSIDINQSAEAFINKFKQQLRIQRLESIENYEQMLARGT